MPAKWQKWMPFHIDSFYGSPWVQAMHPVAQSGYLKLLAAQWQTSDCTLPADDDDLAVLSGLGKWELWSDYAKTILRHFSKLDDGSLQNSVCLREWKEAKRVFEARQKGGKGKTLETDLDESSNRAHTRTKTETVTKTKRKKQQPSGDEPPADERHDLFRLAIFTAWPDGEPSWNGREGSTLSKLLAANPRLTLEGFKRLLKHRRDSEAVNLTARPCTWLERVTDFAGGPLDRYGKPLQAAILPSRIRTMSREEAAAR